MSGVQAFENLWRAVKNILRYGRTEEEFNEIVKNPDTAAIVEKHLCRRFL